jgi:hypothetical protein
MATTVRVNVDFAAPNGGGLQASIDGRPVASHQWPGGTGAPEPAILQFPIAAGAHTLVLNNPGPDWIGISAVELGVGVPVLAAIGRRNEHFIEAWVWHRKNLFAVQPSAPVTGTLTIDNVPAGSWKVTWWDSEKGVPLTPSVVAHLGGTLRLPTPSITRHAAVVLIRSP